MRRGLALAVIAALLGSTLPGSSLAAQRVQTILQDARPKRVWLTLGEVAGVNVVVYLFDRYVKQVGWAQVSVDSWKANLQHGFNFDGDPFATNQIAHPYSGSLYYNAARSNGMSYWESVPFPFLGSLMWEYFGETEQPSYNDLINTTFGGIALGEITHRLASRVRDNLTTGSGRSWREIGGFAIDPMGGLNRLASGDINKVGPNPPEHNPDHLRFLLLGGGRLVTNGSGFDGSRLEPFIEADLALGDPFEVPYQAPFDVFRISIQLNAGDTSAVGRVSVLGRLYGTNLGSADPTRHQLAVSQSYEYMNTSAYVYGNQAIESAIYSRFRLGTDLSLRTTAGLRAIIMAAVNSEYIGASHWNYDYGPGLGVNLQASLLRRNQPLLSIIYLGNWVATVNGADGSHLVELLGADLRLPIGRQFGLGVSGAYYYRNSYYSTAPDVHRKTPQARFYLVMRP
jgi:hypothetical protein